MKAFGKILGLVLLGLLLIIVALGFALTHLFDPNDYKDEIRQIARDKAHIELTLNGDIGWSLFPWLGLELHEASVATLAKPTEPFADLQMLGLSVRVTSVAASRSADERCARRRPEPAPEPRQERPRQLGRHRQGPRARYIKHLGHTACRHRRTRANDYRPGGKTGSADAAGHRQPDRQQRPR